MNVLVHGRKWEGTYQKLGIGSETIKGHEEPCMPFTGLYRNTGKFHVVGIPSLYT